MQPLGQRFYQDKSGGKHKYKERGNTYCWWGSIIPAERKRDRRHAKKLINIEIADIFS